MKKFGLYSLIIGVAVLLWALPLTAQQGDEAVQPITIVTTVHMFGDDSVVEGAEAVLTRMEHGISMSLDAVGLRPDEAYTIWWLIFDAPSNCSDGVCGINDVYLMDSNGDFILDGNGLRQLNRASNEAAQMSALWAAGSIAYRNGTAHFEGHLPIGDTTGDVWFGHGLSNPMGADIHLIIREHGQAVPSMLQNQLYRFDGGACPNPVNQEPCKNIEYAIFTPPE